MENIIELHNVKKEYENFTLDIEHLMVPKGCIMGFIGENGAGKSTTIKLILDIVHKNSGEIKVFGEDNQINTKELKDEIGVVFDENNFPEVMNAKDINCIMKRIYSRWDEKIYFSYVEKFQLPKKTVIKEYSRGMKMKLSIAVALSHKAKLLLLDEATSGLDPVVRDEILDVFLEFIQNEECSIFLSSHITSDLQKIADYITFIHKGKILLSQAKDDLLYQYGVLKCTSKVFEEINKKAVIAYRKNEFGIDALVYRNQLKGNYTIEKPFIDDIMLYYIKGEKVNA